MVFLIVLLIICIFVLFNNLSKLKNEIWTIKSDLKSTEETNHYLKSEVFRISKLIENGTKPIEGIAMPDPVPAVEIIPEIIESPIPEPNTINEIIPEPTPIIEDKAPTELEKIILRHESAAVPRAEKATYADIHAEEKEEKAYVESAFSIFIKKAEKQFADNWTGILGTAIMVLGIGYLSIYTALKVAPVFRVLILWLYAGLLMGCYYFLNKKEKWTKTGLWLRSAGASLFLFGCFGASQIPALAFISNDAAGYLLLGFGIALNLYIGYIIRQQTFLSLHVVLSMLILCVIPDKLLVTFLLAAITATIGIVLSYKEKWEYHLLIVIAAFIIFDIWFNAEGTSLTKMQNIFAIIGIILVFVSCMFMQYRAVYENTRFEKAAFITHLTNWILFSVGLLLHSTGSHFKTFILFAAAIACFFIALRARKKKIFWLYHLDGMVSFILFALSAILLSDWHVGVDIIACILYLITVVCLFVVYNQKEALLHKIFIGINHLAVAGLIVFSIVLVTGSLDAAKITNAVISSSILALLALSIPVFTAWKKYTETPDPFYGDTKTSVNGLVSIVLSVAMFMSWKNQFGNAFLYVMIVTALLWCFLRLKFESRIFDLGRLFFFASGVAIGIIVLSNQGKLLSDWIYGISIIALIAFNWTVKRFYKDEFMVRFTGIIGFNALLLTFCCKYLSNYQIVMFFSFFAIALLNHEFLWFHFKRKSLVAANEIVLYGLYYAFVFIGTVGFLGMPWHYTNTQIGLVFLGFSAVEGYVLFSKRWTSNSEEALPKWKNFNLLNSELLIFNALLFGFSCLKLEYMMMYLAVLAVIIQLAFQKFEE
ncbi:MAG TPA: hypothetical protein VK476_07610, partial [Flavobacterium sp.]|nr:hypothetical protein [Flavobacterium sp.]